MSGGSSDRSVSVVLPQEAHEKIFEIAEICGVGAGTAARELIFLAFSPEEVKRWRDTMKTTYLRRNKVKQAYVAKPGSAVDKQQIRAELRQVVPEHVDTPADRRRRILDLAHQRYGLAGIAAITRYPYSEINAVLDEVKNG